MFLHVHNEFVLQPDQTCPHNLACVINVSLMSCFSNIGGAAINEVALDFWHSGQNREDIGMEDLEHLLRAEAMEAEGSCTSQTHHNRTYLVA